jgi:hypothetical protein
LRAATDPVFTSQLARYLASLAAIDTADRTTPYRQIDDQLRATIARLGSQPRDRSASQDALMDCYRRVSQDRVSRSWRACRDEPGCEARIVPKPCCLAVLGLSDKRTVVTTAHTIPAWVSGALDETRASLVGDQDT